MPCLSAADVLFRLLRVCSNLNCSHRAMQSDGKLKGTQLKSNCGSVTVFKDFPVLFVSDSDN